MDNQKIVIFEVRAGVGVINSQDGPSNLAQSQPGTFLKAEAKALGMGEGTILWCPSGNKGWKVKGGQFTPLQGLPCWAKDWVSKRPVG